MYDLRDCLEDPASVGSGALSAKAMNNLSQILGRGVNPATGESEFFMLNPVPEPSGLLALGGGMLALAGVIRRRRAAIREDAARPAMLFLTKD
jgi:hypothetical protein